MEARQNMERVLGMKLTVEQEERIKDGWRAFYEEPEKYKDSVVVDMVKLSLHKNQQAQ